MIFSVSPYTAKILEDGDKKMAKKMTTKVLCCLVVIVILMSTMPASVFALGNTVTATAQLRSLQNQEGTELGYDDGKVEGYASSGRDGYAVFFSNDKKQNIKGIRICSARYDDTTREFDIEIWDNDLKTLYSATYDYTDFFPVSYTPLDSSDLKWVTIDVPNIEVTGNFYVAIFTYSGPFSWGKNAHLQASNGGIAIGHDSNTKSENSFVVAKNPNTIVDWPTTWDLCQEDTDWMIRAVVCGANGEGHAPVIKSITADPSVVSQGGSSTITVVASDLDGNALSYSYEATGGEISGDGSVVTWTADVAAPGAPPIVGKFKIDVTVSDGKAGVGDTVDIAVASSAHNEYTFVTMWPELLPQPWYFSKPHGIAVDSSGNVFVADTQNNQIQKFDSNGIFITKWVSPYPYGIAVDSSGNVFVTGNNQIQKFDSNGIFITKWGEKGSGNGEFHMPWGIAVDSRGYIYVADTYNLRIQKFDSDGNFITKWGWSGIGGRGFPCGITVDSSGNVFVTEADPRLRHLDLRIIVMEIRDSRILKFDSDGNFITKWDACIGDGSWSGIPPYGIAVDSSGYVYVADTGNDRIHKFDSDGNFVTSWDSWGARDEKFDFPFVIAVDSGGNVFVVDAPVNGRILKFDSDGNFIAKWGSSGTGEGEFDAPYGIEVDNNGNVFVADAYNGRILKFDSGGNFITKWGRSNHLSWPYGVSVDNRGYVYVADTWNGRIQKFDSDGNFIIKWRVEGTYINPYGIAVDSSGNVFVAASWKHRIQKFDSDGIFITKWGEKGSGNGEFDLPWGIAVDSSGNVFVADKRNHRIQKFDSVGNFITKWGDLGSERGEFSHPHGIAIDGGGNVYVADTGNSRIQKFAPTKGGDTPPSDIASELEELISNVESFKETSIHRITTDTDDVIQIQANVYNELFGTEDEDFVLNSLQFASGMLDPGGPIMHATAKSIKKYLRNELGFKVLKMGLEASDRETVKKYAHALAMIDIGTRAIPDPGDNFVIGDVNNDGKNDILGSKTALQYNNNTGIFDVSFSPLTNILEDTDIFTIGDIYNDGKNEIVVYTSDSKQNEEDIMLFSYNYDDTNGIYREAAIRVIGSKNVADVRELKIGDIDNDGKNEIILREKIGAIGNDIRAVAYRLDKDNIQLLKIAEFQEAGFIRKIEIGDADNDNKNETLLLTYKYNHGMNDYLQDIVVYRYNFGQFERFKEFRVGVDPPWTNMPIVGTFVIGDMDNDGKNEIIISKEDMWKGSIHREPFHLTNKGSIHRELFLI